ncbi:uncharacterized protein LOC129604800 [Betta splendens]|uniref:ribonuclease H n=1 Tax=Betta splendens TaxID=158456 RepID=A0A9W2Y3U1_BETSP|nr:uncharacterized protein LOC129604800 [Betta splendens]
MPWFKLVCSYDLKSSKTQHEPTIEITIQDTKHRFMVDTGATYSCIGKEGAGLPLSSSSMIRTVGFSGKTQVIPLTEPIPIKVAGKTISAPLLYSADTPINLLGRDILCSLKARIMCTPDGVAFDIPDDKLNTMVTLIRPSGDEECETKIREALVYWLKLTSPDSHLKQEWEEWKLFVTNYYEKAQKPTLSRHCTMLYDNNQSQEEYGKCWDELINNTTTAIQYDYIIIGPQGAAAIVKLPERLQGWFQVSGSAPHITLLIAEGHESHELGPMIREAQQVKQWIPTDCEFIQHSPDQRFIKIISTQANEVIAEKVQLEYETQTIMTLTDEHEELLKQVPPHVWSASKTDVGLVKSASPLQFKVKAGMRLPYQKQYPLKKEAIEGIEPIIQGLVEAGVLIRTRSMYNTPIFPIKKPNTNDYRLVHDLRAINAVVQEETPIVPDPHTLLSNIPPGTKWYTVIDLCSAFFSVPVHPNSQFLFAFTYQGQQYTYLRLPQGFVHSPSIFNSVSRRSSTFRHSINHINVWR